MLRAAGQVGRHGARDRTLILRAYRHGLLVSELVTMRWEQIDFKVGSIHVNRLKNGTASTHPLRGVELRARCALRKDYPDLPYLFVTEREGPMARAMARKLITHAGQLAKLPFPIHPHLLRHACGYKLASEGQPGHARNPTVPRTQAHHANRALHGVEPRSVQGFW